MYCIYGREMGQKEVTTLPEQLEKTLRFSRKQNMDLSFCCQGGVSCS